jgi:hypothetical protein
VDRILQTKHADPDADLGALEADLDARVANLYGVEPDELSVAEETAPSPPASVKASP